MERSPEWTATTFQVRYAETDQMGVVYYANFLIWFEIGRTDFCRQHGFAYREMESQDGLYIMVAEARCRYKAPAHYDDTIEVRTCLREVRRRVLVFGYEIYRQETEELLAEGETVHVITDRDGRPRALPEKYRDLLTGSRSESRSSRLEIRNSNLGTPEAEIGNRGSGVGTRKSEFGTRNSESGSGG